MKRIIFLCLLVLLLFGCSPGPTTEPDDQADKTEEATNPSETSSSSNEAGPDGDDEDISESFTPTPTPDPFSSLYGCEMEVKFVSGPLESKSTNFTVLDQDYFFDKQDKFDPGKGTGVYYEFLHYFILHSSYYKGNILRPLEAEFLRKYLENWGETENEYIQYQMDSLEGSEAAWFCNGKQVFQTEVNGIIRLSHKASEDLWIEPENLEQILKDREGLVSEWIGEINETDHPYLYIGFCGWGSDTLGDDRFAYFRYLIRFEVQDT